MGQIEKGDKPKYPTCPVPKEIYGTEVPSSIDNKTLKPIGGESAE